MYDLIVKNGLVVLASETANLHVAVKDGKFAAIGCDLQSEGAKVIDAAGRYVLPGVVDIHAHFNDPGLPHREDFLTGTSAAAAGGTTTVFDMPLSGNPTVTSVETLELKKRAAAEKAVVDYALWSGLVNDNTDELPEIARAGAVGFKAFTCFAGDDFPYATNYILYKGMMQAFAEDAIVGVHCEDENLVASFEAAARERDDRSIRAFLDCHAPITEVVATRTVLELAKETGARVHICHASLPEVVEAVCEARKSGARVTVETCPHYLVFTEEDLEKQQGFLKCTPPVRTEMDREMLWGLLLDGEIDAVGSDHSPSTVAEKTPEDGDFWQAWGGTNGVQTLLAVMHSEGVLKRGLPLEAMMRMLATNPAMIFGIHPRKGEIRIGGDADFSVFDPAETWTVSPESLLYKNKHTPYMGMKLTGRVKQTYLRGSLVFADGNVVGEPGAGRLITREDTQ